MTLRTREGRLTTRGPSYQTRGRHSSVLAQGVQLVHEVPWQHLQSTSLSHAVLDGADVAQQLRPLPSRNTVCSVRVDAWCFEFPYAQPAAFDRVAATLGSVPRH